MVFRGESFIGLGCPAGYGQGCFGEEGGEEWGRWAWGFLEGGKRSRAEKQ